MSSTTKKIKNKSNNKTAKGTGKNTTMLGIQDDTEASIERTSNGNNTKRTGKKAINNENNPKLNELQLKTAELNEKLEKLNSDIDLQKNLLIEESNQLNIDITEKVLEIGNLTSENNDLMSQLKSIKSNLDDKMKIGEIFLKKMEKIIKEEKILKKNLEIKDRQIEIAKKSQNIAAKDYNRIKNVVENNDAEKESTLNTELENLKNYKIELENENKSLRKIIKEHKTCAAKKAKLKSKLNVMKNAYQFEQKKTNMIESNKLNLEEKKERIKEKIEKEKEDRNNGNRSISYSNGVRRKVLEVMKQKKSENYLVPSRTTKHINDICNTLGAQQQKISSEIKNSNNYDYNSKQKVLFTESEQLQLASIIPPSYLNEFKERFDILENQRYELMDKIKNNHDKKENSINSVKIKLNYTELRKKEQKLLFVDLNSHLSKKNLDISKLKTEINKVIKEYNKWNRLLIAKTNESTKLNKYIRDLKIKNGEVEENNNDINNSTKKRRVINLEKQHNINFEYDM